MKPRFYLGVGGLIGFGIFLIIFAHQYLGSSLRTDLFEQKAIVYNAELGDVQEVSIPRNSLSSIPVSGIGLDPYLMPTVRYWEPEILSWARTYHMDPNMVAIVMQMESCGDPTAVGGSGEYGLFQVMPFHFTNPNSNENFDPEVNAIAALNFLSEGLRYHKGNVELTMAGYNGGHGSAAAPKSSWTDINMITYNRYTWMMYQGVQSGDSEGAMATWYYDRGVSLCNSAVAALGGTAKVRERLQQIAAAKGQQQVFAQSAAWTPPTSAGWSLCPSTDDFGTPNRWDGGNTHTGLDFCPNGQASGQTVVNVTNAYVYYAGRWPVDMSGKTGHGNTVIVYDPVFDIYITYGHLESFAAGVIQGEPLAQGAPIGIMGNTGASAGNHLHFETLCPGVVPGMLRHEINWTVGSGMCNPWNFIRASQQMSDSQSGGGIAPSSDPQYAGSSNSNINAVDVTSQVAQYTSTQGASLVVDAPQGSEYATTYPAGVVIHHTVSQACVTEDASPDFWRADVEANIGRLPLTPYNAIIRRDGTVAFLTKYGTMAYHSDNFEENKLWFAISLDGNFEECSPTEAQWQSLVALIKWARENGAGDNLIGHRQIRETLCPGQNVFIQLGQVASAANMIHDPNWHR